MTLHVERARHCQPSRKASITLPFQLHHPFYLQTFEQQRGCRSFVTHFGVCNWLQRRPLGLIGCRI